MSNFNQRTKTSAELINLLSYHYWDTKLIKCQYQITHFEYGYETHINQDVQNKLRLRQSETAKHIRFAPDFLLFREDNKDSDFLLEYKVTKTPRFTFGDQQWNYGQIEADALENYLNLMSMGVNIAIIIYCPYHSRPLLCGIPDKDWIYGIRNRTRYSSGSGTDFYNIDLNRIIDFSTFMEKFLDIPIHITDSLLNKSFFNKVKNNKLLLTTHSNRSNYNNSKYKTGFNWDSKCTNIS